MALSWIDTIILLLVAFHLVSGYQTGLVRSLFALLGLGAAGFLALFVAPRLAIALVPQASGLQAGLALGLALLLPLLVGRLLGAGFVRLEPRLHVARWSLANRVLGLAPGAAWGLLGAVVLTWLYATFMGPLPAASPVASRVLAVGATPLETAMTVAQEGLPRIYVSREGWELLPVRAEAQAASPTKLEQDMLAMVNRERRSRGLVALKWDGRLAAMGRAHSRDMLARNYFAHEDPEGKTAADRAAKAGLSYMILGENLAFAPNLRIAHQGLMKSPGHRENILRPQFRRLGIGIVRIPAGTAYRPHMEGQEVPPGRYGGYLLVTQVFAK